LSGSKLILRRELVASANRSSVRVEGMTRPLSRRAITVRVVCISSASWSCVSPARACFDHLTGELVFDAATGHEREEEGRGTSCGHTTHQKMH
jgi:hypothetical protein